MDVMGFTDPAIEGAQNVYVARNRNQTEAYTWMVAMACAMGLSLVAFILIDYLNDHISDRPDAVRFKDAQAILKRGGRYFATRMQLIAGFVSVACMLVILVVHRLSIDDSLSQISNSMLLLGGTAAAILMCTLAFLLFELTRERRMASTHDSRAMLRLWAIMSLFLLVLVMKHAHHANTSLVAPAPHVRADGTRSHLRQGVKAHVHPGWVEEHGVLRVAHVARDYNLRQAQMKHHQHAHSRAAARAANHAVNHPLARGARLHAALAKAVHAAQQVGQGQSAEEAKSLGPEQGGDDEETLTEKRHQEWTARKMERHRGHEAQRD